MLPHQPEVSEFPLQVRAAKPPLDFESLLGRYGMLVIAVVAAGAAGGAVMRVAVGGGYSALRVRVRPPDGPSRRGRGDP